MPEVTRLVPEHLAELTRLAERLRALHRSVTINLGAQDRRLLVTQAEHEIHRYLFRFREVLPAGTSHKLVQSIGTLRRSLSLLELRGDPREVGH